ncbi:hypothetical protein L1987_46852 [Smallanthus sonchifolius]|uniref:Uncharacterized protein n=1 Tax=Smallanthus sonchifolius TaxID=185202 RepID=A0ACB9G1I6_9ASTR|nr:hypothetical protein L1987_46852 [Smallanthus sonchifolius]
MVLMFPVRHASFGPRLFLVIHLLLDPVPPHVPNLLRGPLTSKPFGFPPLQPCNPHRHVVSLAGILSVVSNPWNLVNNLYLLRGLRVPVLGSYHRSPERVFSVHEQLPDGFTRVQRNLPYWGSSASLQESHLRRRKKKKVAFSPDHRDNVGVKGDDVPDPLEADRIGCREIKDRDI